VLGCLKAAVADIHLTFVENTVLVCDTIPAAGNRRKPRQAR